MLWIDSATSRTDNTCAVDQNRGRTNLVRPDVVFLTRLPVTQDAQEGVHAVLDVHPHTALATLPVKREPAEIRNRFRNKRDSFLSTARSMNRGTSLSGYWFGPYLPHQSVLNTRSPTRYCIAGS